MGKGIATALQHYKLDILWIYACVYPYCTCIQECTHVRLWMQMCVHLCLSAWKPSSAFSVGKLLHTMNNLYANRKDVSQIAIPATSLFDSLSH